MKIQKNTKARKSAARLVQSFLHFRGDYDRGRAIGAIEVLRAAGMVSTPQSARMVDNLIHF